jgi:hypothetical protein
VTIPEYKVGRSLTWARRFREFRIDVKDGSEGLDGLSSQRGRVTIGVDLSDSHFIGQHRVSVEFVTMQQEHSPKNLPWEQFVLVLSLTRAPCLDG